MLKVGMEYELAPFRKTRTRSGNHHVRRLYQEIFVETVRFLQMYHGHAMVIDNEGRRRLCNPDDLM